MCNVNVCYMYNLVEIKITFASMMHAMAMFLATKHFVGISAITSIILCNLYSFNPSIRTTCSLVDSNCQHVTLHSVMYEIVVSSCFSEFVSARVIMVIIIYMLY